jgi:hypothetical protein
MVEFPLPDVGSDVQTLHFKGDWPFVIVQCRARTARLENNELVELTGDDEARVVHGVWQGVELLHTRRQLQVNHKQMMIALSRA